ncbi:hypothetical protein, partial [Segatella sp.]|uniref:hypothetical protein n=1 Tax=Segatella sp. TaxID=2974253 RepID=UPI003AAC9609
MSKIKRIWLNNFKFFGSSSPIELAGEHLLLYGENGSGKSSLCYGLNTLPSNPQPIGFSGILLAKRQNSFYCTYFLHNRNVADTKSPYPIKRLEVI